ncbi:NO-inducible flavohemoprotein [Pseudoalteromonas sp. J010]|uniref:NO-inducible flavohemoprotein n=1 Tax=Pseudoalteromonas sp. J010 TaxID=998465 RepID=UPI000F653BE9|nr:NO-inducible flavohemoprotein [Pseudoalteromonas sp. J010]RRS07957.1 NO-inducible flavohemoprotein [Pseudoalteromonas sp. J010]
MLTNETIRLVKQSAPLLAKVGPEITAKFYHNMFTEHPELRGVFNQSHQTSGSQPLALFSALAAYATYIDQPGVLNDAILRINHKHVSLGISPAQYNIVGHHLINTLKTELKEQFTHEVEQAWISAYQFLADLFITAEHGLYQHALQQVGGWQGTRDFYIDEVVNHTPNIKSFYLSPCDGKAIPKFKAGQFVSVFVPASAQTPSQIRQYSLSAAPNSKHFRISVKSDGLVSQYLHTLKAGDTVKLTPPAGDFTAKETNRPKIYISAGVGITPMLSMLAVHSQTMPDIEAYFLHANKTFEDLGFLGEINELGKGIKQFSVTNWLESKEHNALPGFMDISAVAASLPCAHGEFYLCGPLSFMAAIKAQLLRAGVSPSRIYYEVFGPHENLPSS